MKINLAKFLPTQTAALLVGVLMTCMLLMPQQAAGQWLKEGLSEIKSPLIDSDPFDIIILNERGEDAVLKVKPLGKELPEFPLAERGQLVFELFADFDERLEVPYGSIKEVRTFNEMLIKEADAWIANKEYAKALRNLLFVYDNGGGDNPQVVEAMRDCMFLDATQNFSQGRFELALSIFEDIYATQPDFKVEGFDQPLIDIIMMCYDGIIQRKFENEEYMTVRQNVQVVVERYPEKAQELEARWQQKFLQRSDELLQEAREYAEAGKGRLAHQAARQADQMVPDREEVLAYQGYLLNRFPMIIVGVSQPPGDMDPNRIEHWGARRVGRLTQRRLLELTGLSDEGGVYTFLNGTFYRSDDAGMKYTFELKEDPTRFAVPPLNAFQLATRLLDRGKPDSPSYSAAWGKIVDQVMIEDESHVSFTLRTPFIRPEALLSMPYQDAGEDGEPVQNGPYRLGDADGDILTFELNGMYTPEEGRQHPVITEQLYSSASLAVDELLRTNVDVVDRVPPADVKRLKDNPEFTVRPYALPTVHFLVPKIRESELRYDPNFRSGLSHTIDRELIIKEVICDNNDVDGCEPISGPFPLGTESNDQIAYGYDLRARPIAFNEKLGLVLQQLAMQAKPPERPEPLPPPSLTIIHPNSSTAASGAEAIARMWTQAGIPTETRSLKTGQSMPDDPNWDFLYLEVTVEEPLADAIRMIGSQGYANDVSAPVRQTLRILNYSRSWQTACAALRRLHRQIRVDLSVIPLWQVTEHYAYRNTIRYLGRDLVHLYQNVDRWKIDLTAEEEEE